MEKDGKILSITARQQISVMMNSQAWPMNSYL
jgi:hypothetical protein